MYVLGIWPTSYRTLVKYLPSHKDMSLQELENVGRDWVALVIMHGPCTNSDSFLHNKDDTLLTVTCQNLSSIT